MVGRNRANTCGRLAYAGLQLALLLVTLLTARRADAQVAEAAVGGEERLAGGVMASAFHIDYGKRWLAGSGVYVDTGLNPHLGLEGEARWLFANEEAGTHLSTYVGGPRYSFNARGKLRPYAKMLAGVGYFYFPYGYAKGSYLVVEGGGGVDYRVNHHISIRLIDVEYQTWPTFTFGSMSSYGANAGVRYAFR